MSERPLAGRVALVTDGTSEVPFAIAKALALAGADIGLVSRGMGRAGNDAADVRGKLCTRSVLVDGSLGDHASLAAAHEAVTSSFGPVSVLVVAPGFKDICRRPDGAIIRGSNAMGMRDALGAARLMALCLPAMRSLGFGRILVVSTIVGVLANRAGPQVVAAEHALGGLVAAVALENAKHGVTANRLVAGLVETSELKSRSRLGFFRHRPYTDRMPVGRLGQPWEIARVIAFLAEPASAFVTGATWPVDGGWTMRGDPGGDPGPLPERD